jgi:hypothetical protein
MQQTISPAPFEKILPAYIERSSNAGSLNSNAGSLKRFLNWCDQQEKNRLLWLGLAIMGHIGMVLPLTLLAILFLANNNFILWTIVLVANMPVLALNLAAQPPKVTIPVMAASLFINLAVIITSVVAFLI